MDAFLELFSTRGRVNRAWYFWHIVLDDLVIFSMAVLLVLTSGAVGEAWVALPFVGLILAGTWAAIAVTVKRFHDLARPGWHWFLFMIPIYNFYLGLVLLFKGGTPGTNPYGPDPLRAPRRGGPVAADTGSGAPLAGG